jgi:GGDEF domain-containing protein
MPMDGGREPAPGASRYEELFDPSTGLPTEALLRDRLTVALARAQRSRGVVAVFAFADITPLADNDLVSITAALLARLRPDDTVARVASRELVAVCNDIFEDEHAAFLARRLLETSGMTCRLGVVLGKPGDDPEELVARARREATRLRSVD